MEDRIIYSRFVANNFFQSVSLFSSFLQSILQRGGTFRIFVPFCGTSIQPLSGKGFSALSPKSSRISRPNVPPLSILQYRASSPPSKKIYIAEPASHLSASAPLTPNRDVFLVFGTILAIMLGETWTTMDTQTILISNLFEFSILNVPFKKGTLGS